MIILNIEFVINYTEFYRVLFVSAARIVNLLMCLMIGVHLVLMIIFVRFVCLVVRIGSILKK